ncbi:MAG: hypothetical protein QOH79_2781 [Acidimicrobiaceae bacterium]
MLLPANGRAHRATTPFVTAPDGANSPSRRSNARTAAHSWLEGADPGVTVAAGPLDVAGLLDAGEAIEQFLEHDSHLQSSEVGAKAVVHTPTEREIDLWSGGVRRRRRCVVELEEERIRVAPPPVLTGLVRANERVTRLRFPVLGRVPVG